MIHKEHVEDELRVSKFKLKETKDPNEKRTISNYRALLKRKLKEQL